MKTIRFINAWDQGIGFRDSPAGRCPVANSEGVFVGFGIDLGFFQFGLGFAGCPMNWNLPRIPKTTINAYKLFWKVEMSVTRKNHYLLIYPCSGLIHYKTL